MVEIKGRRIAGWAALVLLSFALLGAGYLLLFTTFMLYDDEGYVLISLKNFSLHGHLYSQVYSQYGPFPYLLYDAIHRLLHFDFTNVAGRWITLVCWMTASSACAALVYRCTRSLVWAAFTLAGTFTYLWIMVREPIHPGGLIVAITSLATWLGMECWQARRYHLFTLSAAVSTSVLLLTKINVGVFFGAATVAWLAVNTHSKPTARYLAWMVALGAVALPFGLMHTLIDAAWIRTFALVFSAAILGTLIFAFQTSASDIQWKHWSVLAMGIAGVVAFISILTMLRGTSFHMLLSGVIFEPIKHPGVYFFAIKWARGATVFALMSMIGVAVLAARHRWKSRNGVLFIAAIRIGLAATWVLVSLELLPLSLVEFATSFGLSLVWVFVIPVTTIATAPRAWLALVLIFQFLQAYPVAGSQLNWGTFLWVPLLVLGLADVAPLLRPAKQNVSRWTVRIWATATLFLAVYMTGKLLYFGWTFRGSSPPLGLAGAESIRPQSDLTPALKVINLNLKAHGDVLFSLPGLYSVNLWTGLPTPTLANATHWFSLLNAGQQQEIIDRLSQAKRPVLLVQRDLLDYLARTGFHPSGLLYGWLMGNFKQQVSFGGYEIWVRRDRTIAGLSTAVPHRVYENVIDKLTVTLQPVAGAISRIDLCNARSPDSPLLSFTRANTSVTTFKCGIDGEALEIPTSASFPLTIPPGISKVVLSFDPLGVNGQIDGLLLVLRDRNGTRLGDIVVAK